MVTLDSLDKDILNSILSNSRRSFRQIAKIVGASPVTVMTRMKRLETEGIIKGYTANIDYDLLGYDLQTIIDIRVSKGKLMQVASKLAKHPNVCSVYDNTGHFDTTIIARFKNRRSMDSFLKTIQGYEFIERTETKVVLNTVKEDSLKF